MQFLPHDQLEPPGDCLGKLAEVQRCVLVPKDEADGHENLPGDWMAHAEEAPVGPIHVHDPETIGHIVRREQGPPGQHRLGQVSRAGQSEGPPRDRIVDQTSSEINAWSDFVTLHDRGPRGYTSDYDIGGRPHIRAAEHSAFKLLCSLLPQFLRGVS